MNGTPCHEKWQGVLASLNGRVNAVRGVEMRDGSSSLVVDLQDGQFIRKLVAAVQVSVLSDVNFGEPPLHFGWYSKIHGTICLATLVLLVFAHDAAEQEIEGCKNTRDLQVEGKGGAGATMEPMDLSWQEYEQHRRRLNAQLGLMVFALLPLPAILVAVGLSPLRMLLVVVFLGVSIGILYPMWWRTKHNPLRATVVEKRTRRIAWVCRPVGFLFGIGAMLSWSVGSISAEWVSLAFSAAAVLLLWFSYSSEKKAKQEL